MKRISLLFLFMNTLLFSSCGLAYSVLLGINQKAEWMDKKALEERAKKLDLPPNGVFQLDTAALYKAFIAQYKSRISEIDPADTLAIKAAKGQLKDNLQPVHVRYFDKNGAPIYWMINCYVDPVLPKMNWNIDSSFNFFPPRPFAPLNDSLTDSLSFFIPHIRTLEGNALKMADLPDADYYVLVLWNDVFERPSKRLIQLLNRYHKTHADKKVTVLFVNNQNAYLWAHMDPKQRAQIVALDTAQ